MLIVIHCSVVLLCCCVVVVVHYQTTDQQQTGHSQQQTTNKQSTTTIQVYMYVCLFIKKLRLKNENALQELLQDKQSRLIG
jgi:hypothetical protein